jgi:MFS family permease
VWAGLATILSGIVAGLVAFIAVRVLTGLGEGAFYSNDRSLIAEQTPIEKRSLGMGFVITGLAIGITIATVFAPDLIDLGGSVFAADQAWRMAFLVLGGVTLCVAIGVARYFSRQEPGLPYARATLHMLAFAAIGLAAVMGVYFLGDAAGLSDLWIAVVEVALAVTLVAAVLMRRTSDVSTVLRSRDLMLINLAFIAVLWNLWFFSFWSVSIVADAAHSSFGRSALIAAFNAGAGILGFPTGGWLSDVAVRRGIGRKPLVVGFTAAQCVLTVGFGLVVAGGAPPVWLMAALLFSASTFFNAMQPIAQAMLADIADPAHHGAAFGMNNLIGEIGAVLSPAVSGTLRDATGGWTAAIFLDAGLIAGAVILFVFVREASSSRVLRSGRFERAAPATERVGAAP